MTRPITVTLGQIAALRPCNDRWRAALSHLGVTPEGFDAEHAVSIGDVALTCGLGDALWLLRLLDPRTRVRCVFPSVLRVAAHTTDQRVHDCNAATQRWLDGDDSVDLAAARDAAWTAALGAEDAALGASGARAAAALDAAWAAARAAALGAEDAALAAEDAALAARAAAAGAAAAWAATWAAAWDAANAAVRTAAYAAVAAGDAAERARQLTDLLATVGHTLPAVTPD